MRDAAGEPADRFHLLRLAQLLLEPAAFGDVARVDHDCADRRVVQPIHRRRLHASATAVRVLETHFGRDRRAGMPQRLGHAVSRPLAIVGVQEIEQRSAEHLTPASTRDAAATTRAM